LDLRDNQVNLPTGQRNTNLDALRAIAILMVLGRHGGMAIALLHVSASYAVYWARVGWAGVDLFFVLSGFLISGLLFKGYQERRRIDISRFYIRRGFKIWPAFYVLIVTGLLVDLVRPGHHFSMQRLIVELLFVQDYFRGIWGITWSLAVEEHFYLILPLVLLLMIRRDREKPFAALPYVFAVIAIFALVCRFAVGWKQDGTIDPWTCVFPTHLRIDGLMFGVLLCYYQSFRPIVFGRIVSWRGGWIVIAATVALLSTFPLESRNMHTWGFTVIYLGAGFLVAKAVASEGLRPVRVVSSALARIGLYSYSIYLWHMFFIWRVLGGLSHFHDLSPVLLYWCSIIGPILFGIAAAKAIEIPVLRFRDRVFPPVPKSGMTSNTPASTEGLAEAASGGVLPD
jgi:peptidoglycan/LPS O-acetylase OafA/YrhL